MADYNLELTDHPARARHPTTGESMPSVPLLPDHKSIRLDGRVIAYVNPAGAVSFIVSRSKLGEVIYQEALALANVTDANDLLELETDEDADNSNNA